MHVKVRTKAAKRLTATVKVENPALSMDDAEAQLVRAKNKILDRDDAARTFLVAQAVQEQVIEAGTFIPDAVAFEYGLLPAGTVLVACPDCKEGVAYRACTACTSGKDADGQVCRDCDGGCNELGGPCPTCGGHAKVAPGA